MSATPFILKHLQSVCSCDIVFEQYYDYWILIMNKKFTGKSEAEMTVH